MIYDCKLKNRNEENDDNTHKSVPGFSDTVEFFEIMEKSCKKDVEFVGHDLVVDIGDGEMMKSCESFESWDTGPYLERELFALVKVCEHIGISDPDRVMIIFVRKCILKIEYLRISSEIIGK